MSEGSGGLSNSNDDELKEVIGENLLASINGDDEELQEEIGENLPATIYGEDEEQDLVEGKKQQGQRFIIILLVFLAGLFGYCTIILSVVVILLSDTKNQTSSDNYCMARGAQLAKFESQEELNFLNRYKGPFDHWIGLHRESSHHPWMWTDTTEYNNLTLIRGEGQHAYLSDRGISSGRDYIRRRWICSKPNSSALQCPGVS